MEEKSLKQRYLDIVDEYIKIFESKQELDLEYWIGQKEGHGVAAFGDYFFNLEDIIYDIDHNIEKGKILDWQTYTVDFHVKHPKAHSVNYDSYCMGFRYELIKRKSIIQKIKDHFEHKRNLKEIKRKFKKEIGDFIANNNKKSTF